MRIVCYLAIGFGASLVVGCSGLPQTDPPVIRGISPTFDQEDEATEIDTPHGSLVDGDAKSIDEPREISASAQNSRQSISRERSAFVFGEDPQPSSLLPDSTDDSAGFGVFPPTVEGTDEFFGAEFNCDSYRFWDDAKAMPGVLWADAKSLFTWQNAVVLGTAGGAALWIRDDLDQKVRHETAEHPSRWGQGSVVLRQFGEYTYQVPVLAGVYAAGLWTQDETLHEFSLSVLSAYGLSAAATLTLKGITNTQRPTDNYENGHYGFPSFHTASTFTIAACLEEYYGWQVGVPAYVLAGLVGWSRIDQREHDLSDVLFGAVLGVVIGKTVSAAHLDRQSDLKIAPYYDLRNQATGVSVEKRF